MLNSSVVSYLKTAKHQTLTVMMTMMSEINRI